MTIYGTQGLMVTPSQSSHSVGFYDNENARFLLDCAHVMIVTGVICFFGSVFVRFEATNYETAKKRSGTKSLISVGNFAQLPVNLFHSMPYICEM